LWPTLAEVIFVKTRSYGFIAALWKVLSTSSFIDNLWQLFSAM
jgi:hypothetical protein